MIITKYQNGNTTITLEDDGTKTIEYPDGQEPIYDFPNSIDCKITNYCNNTKCRPWCHEQSSPNGLHCNPDDLLAHLSLLPAGIEIAIGGGSPTKYPKLKTLLIKLGKMGFVPNLTINQFHIGEDFDLVKKILPHIYGLGISYSQSQFEFWPIQKIYNDSIVFHLIIGIHEPEDVLQIKRYFKKAKILLLGYKEIGNGIAYYHQCGVAVDHKVMSWVRQIPTLIKDHAFAFDNLAIEQLRLRRLFTDSGWEKYYMGDDFTQSMYVDAVKGEFAPTSCSADRISWNKCSILEFFETRRSYEGMKESQLPPPKGGRF